MEPRSLHVLASACGGELINGSPAVRVSRVSTDSRSVGPGDLFVALKGEHYDGHEFLPEVAARGAVAVLAASAARARLPAGLPAILAADPRVAYGQMAASYRREFDLPMICVGGSNGKTTTKELTAAVLGGAGPTLKSEASYNNDVGVPATLLRVEACHRAAVLEAGTNHPGELAPLIRMIAPRVGVITSVGREHLEFFGSLEGVAEEEGWLAELLPPAEQGGVLVLPGGIEFEESLVRRTRARVVRVGFGGGNDWKGGIRAMDWSGTTFSVRSPHPAWNGEYTMILPGRHSVPNALLALAVACELGVEPTAARDGLAAFQTAPHRLAARGGAGVQVLDDTYNANPDSMLAALQTLSDLPCAGRRVAVLGDMAELGSMAGTAHAEVGRAAVRLGIETVFAVGKFAAITAGAAGQGMDHAFTDLGDASAAVIRFVRPGDAVLVKASRASRLERLVDALLKQLELREETQIHDFA